MATTDRDAWFLDSISNFLHSEFSLFQGKQSKHPWSFNCHSCIEVVLKNTSQKLSLIPAELKLRENNVNIRVYGY